MNKRNIKLLIALSIFYIILFILFFTFSKKDADNTGYMLLEDLKRYEFKNNTWKKISKDDIYWKKYKVYSQNKYIDSYYPSKNNKLYFFNDNNESKLVNSPFIAFSEKLNIKLLDYKSDSNITNNDLNYITKYLKSKKINYNGEYSVLNKYLVDLDDNNKEDIIYVASNQLYSDDVFYIIFAKIKNKYIDIIFEQDEIVDTYDLQWVLSSSNKKYHDIILYSFKNETYVFDLYHYLDNKYIKIK